jgi:NADH-quinone oxidoreductase subunit G/NADP-reducing hydrogenase subunit HndD
VKYIEFYRPDLIRHLTTSRSPQIHSGGAYKTWWAEREGIDPKDIVVVSFMPCTSKKYEAKHEKMKINGMYPVDHVLTVREFATLLRKRNIDLISLDPSEVDEAGAYSGAAAIYGASGGVMESALRTAYEEITGEELKRVEFKQVRGMKGIKKATIEIGDKQLKVVIAATAKNVRKVLAELERDPDAFHYMEVMACPGGCIGGGGQPIPTADRIVKQRIECLYQIDEEMKLRKAHENPVVREFFDDYIAMLPHEKQAAILHTSYSKKQKFE